MFGLVSGLVGAGLSFIGGKKNRKSQERIHAREQYLNSPQGIRDEAEKAGFNPLTVMNSGRQFGAGYAPQFGNEYAALGQGLADAATGYEQLQIQRAELELETQRLKELQKATAMGPKVAGIYGPRNGGNNKNGSRSVSGRSGGSRNDGSTSDTIGSMAHLAPDRELEVSPFTSGAGVIELSNKGTDLIGGPIAVPGDDGEPWGFDELLTAVVAGVPQVAMRGGEMMTLGNPYAPMISAAEAKKFREEQKREREKRRAEESKKNKKSEAQRRREEKAMRDADRRMYPRVYQ